MKMVNLKNKNYLIVLTLIALISVLFQNCSNYSASIKSVSALNTDNSNLQMIADTSPALNDVADNIPIHLDDVVSNENDMSSTDMSSSLGQADPSDLVMDDPVENNDDLVNSSDVDDDRKCYDNGGKNCEDRNHCSLLAKAGGSLKGFNVISLTAGDKGKNFSNHGKTIYSYSGSSTLYLNSIKSSGNTVICGNISINKLSSNGNCHLFYTQVEQANINGNISTSIFDDKGLEKEIDFKSGKEVKSCKVNADFLILPL